MSLFNDLGRKVEELKQEVSAGSDGDITHQCEACEELLHEDHDGCPACGSEAVVALQSE